MWTDNAREFAEWISVNPTLNPVRVEPNFLVTQGRKRLLHPAKKIVIVSQTDEIIDKASITIGPKEKALNKMPELDFLSVPFFPQAHCLLFRASEEQKHLVLNYFRESMRRQ